MSTETWLDNRCVYGVVNFTFRKKDHMIKYELYLAKIGPTLLESIIYYNIY